MIAMALPREPLGTHERESRVASAITQLRYGILEFGGFHVVRIGTEARISERRMR
jgi:hypothetical protein